MTGEGARRSTTNHPTSRKDGEKRATPRMWTITEDQGVGQECPTHTVSVRPTRAVSDPHGQCFPLLAKAARNGAPDRFLDDAIKKQVPIRLLPVARSVAQGRLSTAKIIRAANDLLARNDSIGGRTSGSSGMIAKHLHGTNLYQSLSTLTLFLSILCVQGQHRNGYATYCICDLPASCP